ncbi:hypothetical protein ACFVT8_12645 [Lysinibacillus sp. NPDC058147]|uniref:hypothetical protein n=1 Tax=unclassified Lysinibacillus TaxID=2636778 RepID=UPI0036DBA031
MDLPVPERPDTIRNVMYFSPPVNNLFKMLVVGLCYSTWWLFLKADHFAIPPEQFSHRPDHFTNPPEQFSLRPDHFAIPPEQFSHRPDHFAAPPEQFFY